MGVYMSTCLTRSIVISKVKVACGRGHIKDNEFRWRNWTSRWFHTDNFIREYLFST